MNPGEGRLVAWTSVHASTLVWTKVHTTCVVALLVCAALAGCATDRGSVEKNLMSNRESTRRGAGVAETYQVGCPDVLEVRVPLRTELSGQYAVGPTGRIELGDYGTVRVEGRTLAEIARLIASETGQSPQDVELRVAQFRSQYVFLFGQVIGWQRTFPYQGQETILDLLQRVGGITLGAEPREVYVVRTHLGDSQRPEIFHVDLNAIVMKRDEQTNIRILPFDQVYVGETRQVHIEKSFPPWLRPIYQSLWDMLPDPGRQPAAAPPPQPRFVSGQVSS
jgi:protein involved in polysaccharide export with SLBB domain